MSSAPLTELAYRRIREELICADLLPGDRVSEQLMALRFGIGRMPIREAIKQFQAEGLMKTVPRLGTFVKTPTRKELTELFETREALESYACYLAAKRPLDPGIPELDSLCEKLRELIARFPEDADPPAEEVARYWEIDIAFHETVARIAGNTLIAKKLDEIRFKERVCARSIPTVRKKFLQQTLSLHLWITRSIRMREPDNARSWGGKHVRQEGKMLSEMIPAELPREFP